MVRRQEDICTAQVLSCCDKVVLLQLAGSTPSFCINSSVKLSQKWWATEFRSTIFFKAKAPALEASSMVNKTWSIPRSTRCSTHVRNLSRVSQEPFHIFYGTTRLRYCQRPNNKHPRLLFCFAQPLGASGGHNLNIVRLPRRYCRRGNTTRIRPLRGHSVAESTHNASRMH